MTANSGFNLRKSQQTLRKRSYIPALHKVASAHQVPSRTPVYSGSYTRSRDFSTWAVRAVIAGWLLFAAVVAVTAFALLGAAWLRGSERISPGVFVGTRSLGGLTHDQAVQVLQNSWDSSQSLLISDGVRTWRVSAAQLGLQLNAPATFQQALEAGHGEDVFDTLSLSLQGMGDGIQVFPVYALDVQAARSGLESLRSQVDIPAIDAALRFEQGVLSASPAVSGYSLDVERTLAYLEANLSEMLARGSAPLFMLEVTPRIGDVTAALGVAHSLLNTSIRVKAHDPISGEDLSWQVSQEELAAWLRVENTPEGPQVSLDQDRLAEYLDRIDASLQPERWLEFTGSLDLDRLRQGHPLQAVVRHAPTTYTISPGDTLIKIAWRVGMPYWKLLEANPGLDEKALWPGQVLSVPSKDDLLPLPVVDNKRIVISISQQRMWVYQDGELLWENVISTGMDRSPTQPGIFQIQTHELEAYASVWDLTMPHWMGIYEAWPGFMNGIHGLPTLSNGQRLWSGSLGRPASYGCIILDLPAAERLFHWAESGVVVEIQP